MNTFNKQITLLQSDFTNARLNLAAMAITYIESLNKQGLHTRLAFYIKELEYSLKGAITASKENKKAYLYMKNEGFKTSELKLMARG